jgi:hypothetical protein
MPNVIDQPRAGAHDPLGLTVCPECGYSLAGLPGEGVCPECGERYDQQYVVLFGETPEGVGKAHGWAGLFLSLAAVAFVLFVTARHGDLLNPPVILILIYLVIYLPLWVIRRMSVRKEILFQVWLNEKGFAVRRPKSETSLLAYVERGLPYLWPILMLPAVSRDTQPLGFVFVISMFVWILVLIGISVIVNRTPARRRIRTNDPRQPTLTRWSRDDMATLESVRTGAARLRIKSCSYLGWWKWNEWKPVRAVVRLAPEQVTELRRRIDQWISAQFRQPPVEVSTRA